MIVVFVVLVVARVDANNHFSAVVTDSAAIIIAAVTERSIDCAGVIAVPYPLAAVGTGNGVVFVASGAENIFAQDILTGFFDYFGIAV
jgi:hypothetical protein